MRPLTPAEWLFVAKGVLLLSGIGWIVMLLILPARVKAERRDAIRARAELEKAEALWSRERTQAANALAAETERANEAEASMGRAERRHEEAAAEAAAEVEEWWTEAGSRHAEITALTRHLDVAISGREAAETALSEMRFRRDQEHPAMMRGPGGKFLGRADRLKTGPQAGVEGSQAVEGVPLVVGSVQPLAGRLGASVGVLADAEGEMQQGSGA